MQAAGQSITNQPAILSQSLSLSLFHVAITHEAEQIYYRQNYWVSDTNEWGPRTCSQAITVLAPVLKARATVFYTYHCCYSANPLCCNRDTSDAVCMSVCWDSGLVELEYIPYYTKSVLADVALEHHLRDPG